MLNEMVLCEELFHTPSGVAFADYWPIRSKRFRAWLRRCYNHATGSAPSAAGVEFTNADQPGVRLRKRRRSKTRRL
jgi:hypothetical protein